MPGRRREDQQPDTYLVFKPVAPTKEISFFEQVYKNSSLETEGQQRMAFLRGQPEAGTKSKAGKFHGNKISHGHLLLSPRPCLFNGTQCVAKKEYASRDN